MDTEIFLQIQRQLSKIDFLSHCKLELEVRSVVDPNAILLGIGTETFSELGMYQVYEIAPMPMCSVTEHATRVNHFSRQTPRFAPKIFCTNALLN